MMPVRSCAAAVLALAASIDLSASSTSLIVNLPAADAREWPSDLQLFVDGKPRTVSVVGPAGPASAVLMLDMSGSMTTSLPMEPVMKGISGLASVLKGDEAVRFLAFGDRIEMGPDVRLDDKEAIQFIRTRQFQNGTRLFAALDQAFSHLERRPVHRVCVVISDGSDNDGRYKKQLFRPRAIAAGIAVHLVVTPPARIGNTLMSAPVDWEFKQLVEESGGTSTKLKSIEEFDATVRSLWASVQSDVVVSVDTSGLKPGSYKVEVRTKRDGVALHMPKRLEVH